MAVPQGQLTGADVAAERARYRVKQNELADEAGLYHNTISPIEDNRIKCSQEQYQEFLEAIKRIADRRAEETATK